MENTTPPYFSGFDPISSEIAKKLIPEAKPIYANLPNQSDAVVICLHGFTGNPYEITPATQACNDIGLDAVAPLLPGHGYQQRSDQERFFAQITKDSMLAAAREEITRARLQYQRVGMIGFSMGGAIALTMAAEGLIDACTVVAPAIRLPLKAEILTPLLGWANFNIDAPAKEPFFLPVYEFYNSKSIQALWHIARHAQSCLTQIRCPLLAIHSHADQTIPPIVLGVLQRQVSGPLETLWFNQSGHCMFLDINGEEVARSSTEFLKLHLLDT